MQRIGKKKPPGGGFDQGEDGSGGTAAVGNVRGMMCVLIK